MAPSSSHYGPDALVIDYHDACIYGRDLQILQHPTAWLNDACIHYALARHQRKNSSNNNNDNTSLWHFVDPAALTCLVHQCETQEELEDFNKGHPRHKLPMVFLPVNDCLTEGGAWRVPGAGTHWSLLVAIGEEGSVRTHDSNGKDDGYYSYYHFDSMSGDSANIVAARNVARQWSRMRKGRDEEGKVVVHEQQTPRQANGYDCALHVLVSMRALSSLNTVDPKEMEEELCRALHGDATYVCRKLRNELVQDVLQQALVHKES